MLDLRDLASRRQQIVEMTTPTGGVRSCSELANGRPIQNCFNATAEPACGLRLGAPDRLQHLHYERSIDGSHRQVADQGIGIRLECSLPLRAVLAVAPGCLMRANVQGSAFCERYPSRNLKLGFGALLSRGRERRQA